jgi:hypothetical protein
VLILAIIVVGGFAFLMTYEQLADSKAPQDTARSAFGHAAWISVAYTVVSIFDRSGDYRPLGDRVPDLLTQGLTLFAFLGAGIALAYLRFVKRGK